jgi:hypothetical protein
VNTIETAPSFVYALFIPVHLFSLVPNIELCVLRKGNGT